MRTSTFKANLSTPIASADEENAGIARLASRQEVLEGSGLPIIATPQPELLLNGFRNKIINGNFLVAQRGTSFAGIPTTEAYTADRWNVRRDGTGLLDVTINSPGDGPNEASGFIRLECATADPSMDAGNYYTLVQWIEGYNSRAFSDSPMTLSFWVRSSIVGTISVVIRPTTTTRSYVSHITINQANTWEKKVIANIPALEVGAPGQTDYTTDIGCRLSFGLAYGSNYLTGTENEWIDGNFAGSNGQTNFMNTLGTTIDFAEVQLEPGYSATPFEYRDPTVENLLCYRYYQKLYWYRPMVIAYCPNGDTRGNFRPFIVPMRTNPTVSVNYSVLNCIWVGAAGNVLNISWDITCSVAGNYGAILNMSGVAPTSVSNCGGVVVGGSPNTYIFYCDAEL